MCLISYCNLYWGCNKGGCKKCLIKFKDYEPDDDCLNLLINENKYESQLQYWSFTCSQNERS